MKLGIKIVIALFLAIFAWEIILQSTVIKTTGTKFHPALGKIDKPGVFVSGEEGFSITRINNFGMRNREISPKTQNIYRILSIGDSYTAGLQVSDNQTYSALLSHIIRFKNKNIKPDVINGGRNGLSPADYIYAADFYRKNLNPDYVVIKITDGDFFEDMFNKNQYIYVEPDKGSFKITVNKNFKSKNNFAQKFSKFDFLKTFSTARIGVERFQQLLNSSSNQTEGPKKNSNADNEKFAKLVDWTVKSLRLAYPEAVILYIPPIDQDALIKGKTLYEKELFAAGKKYNMDVISMRKAFENYYKTNKQPINGFDNTTPGVGHLNQIGHKIVAETVAEYFKNKGITE